MVTDIIKIISIKQNFTGIGIHYRAIAKLFGLLTLASLWLVDADSTALLMEEFYKGLKKGLVLPEALRLAKLSLLSSEKYFHPYYWAGFILVGN
jgi:hypothetical protein